MVKKVSTSDSYQRLEIMEEKIADFDGHATGFTAAGVNDTWTLTTTRSCEHLVTGGADNDNGILHPATVGWTLASETDLTINLKTNIYLSDGEYDTLALCFGLANVTDNDFASNTYAIADGGALLGTTDLLYGFYKADGTDELYLYGGDEYVRTNMEFVNTRGTETDLATAPLKMTLEMEAQINASGVLGVSFAIDEYGGNDFKPMYRYGSSPREPYIAFTDKSPTAAKVFRPVLDIKAGEASAVNADVDYFAYTSNRVSWSLGVAPSSRVS